MIVFIAVSAKISGIWKVYFLSPGAAFRLALNLLATVSNNSLFVYQ
jgi:hypothetical protein